MEHDIEHRCMVLLLRQQPVAGDLRRVSATLKVITDLERIGDHRRRHRRDHAPPVRLPQGRRPRRQRGHQDGPRKPTRWCRTAWTPSERGHERRQKVIAADDEVDYDFNAIKRTLAEEIAADPSQVDAALDLLMVIKYLERIADHAVNLAEWVQFTRTGLYKNEAMF